MRIRSWAVGVVSAAAVVAGVVAVQSGIAGTAALPVLPHRTPASGDGAELPAPVEVGAPPSAGPVRTPADRVVVVAPERRPAPVVRHPTKRPAPVAADKGDKDSADRSGKGPGPKPEPDPKPKPDDKAGKGDGHEG
jgi:hypothetical protein